MCNPLQMFYLGRAAHREALCNLEYRSSFQKQGDRWLLRNHIKTEHSKVANTTVLAEALEEAILAPVSPWATAF